MVDEDQSPMAGGGFMVDDDDEMAGGFLPEDDDDNGPVAGPSATTYEEHHGPSLPPYLPLAEVAHALALVQLPTDDATLSVFKNAAFEDPTHARVIGGKARMRKKEKVISREDFNQVATVLLDNQRRQQAQQETSDDSEVEEVQSRPSKARKKSTAGRRSTKRTSLSPVASSDADVASSSRRPTRAAAAKTRRATQVHLEQVEDDSSVDDGSDDYREASEDSDRPAPRKGRRLAISESESDTSDSGEDEDDDEPARKRARGNTKANATAAKKGRGSKDAGSSPDPRRRKKKVTIDPEATTGTSEGEEDEGDPQQDVKLTKEQREIAKGAWQLFLDELTTLDPDWKARQIKSSKPGAIPQDPRLGTQELSRLAESLLGEKLSEAEVEEMIQLAYSSFAPASSNFATRQGARGLRMAAATASGKNDSGKGGGGVGLDEFAGVLVRGRMI